MESLLEIYKEPLFFHGPVACAGLAFIAFASFATPLTLLAYFQPSWAEPYRIQKRVGQDKIVAPAVKSYLMNGGVFGVALFLLWPLIRLTGLHTGPLPSWWTILLQFVVCVYVEDFTFYWMHRTLHTNKFLFKHIHSHHHQFQVPWAVTGNYMHCVEFLLIATGVFLPALLIGSHVVVMYLFIIFRQWTAANEHCGYELPFSPNFLFPFYEGTCFHDFHHSRVSGNYAAFTGLWDRVFGTVAPGYDEYHLKKKAQ
eukprot:GILJ01003460.1.p1 GENE.GILJ01003460.1~~GILJ01003460.1.p1  ORF type:complete len:255 (-),score=20.97 GILJ01003460.1:164-928(-)